MCTGSLSFSSFVSAAMGVTIGLTIEQNLAGIWSGIKNRAIAVIQVGPTLPALGFIAGLGSVWVIDTLRDQHIKKTQPAPTKDRLSQRLQTMSDARKAVLGCAGLGILASVCGLTGRFSLPINIALSFFAAGFTLGERIWRNGANAQLSNSVLDEFRKLYEAAHSKSTTSSTEVKPYVGKNHALALENTEALIAQGFYTNCNGNKFELKKGAVLSSKSRYFEFQMITPLKQPKYQTVIKVVNQDTLGAAQLETEVYKHVLVVNLASPQYPGGGLEGGRGGQEEDLCYRSELAGFMRDQLQIVMGSLDTLDPEHQRLYPLHRYEDSTTPGSILTPDVTVFRDSFDQSFALLEEPFQISILSSAAPHDLKSIKTNVRLQGKDQNSEEYRTIKNAISAEVEQQAKKAIINQLSVAYDGGYECVVLGAFGCGAFKIPPTIIAPLYKEVIKTYFSGAFKKIVFAIIDDAKEDHNPEGNLKPFQDLFNV